MAFRHLVSIVVAVALVAVAHAKPKMSERDRAFLETHRMALSLYADGPLECYKTNKSSPVFDVHSLSIEDIDIENNRVMLSEYPQYPACVLGKMLATGKLFPSFVYMPAAAVADCGKTCVEKEILPNSLVSNCCCIRNGCNDRMISSSDLEDSDEE